jgi:radical SAM modification target selenobiotic family peptide
MDAKDLKKILAGVTLSGLLAGSALFLAGCARQSKSG